MEDSLNATPSDNEETSETENYLLMKILSHHHSARANIIVRHDKLKWSKVPSPASCTWAHNIVTRLPLIKGNARTSKSKTPLEAWHLIITIQTC